MLAYAAYRRPPARLHPKTLALIIGGHAGLLFAVMTARGDIPVDRIFDHTVVTLIDPVEPPPPPPPPADPAPSTPNEPTIYTPPTPFPLPLPNPTGPLDFGPPTDQAGPVAGTGSLPGPEPMPIPTPPPTVKVGPKPITSEADLTPPYPDEKLRLGEEAVVRLRLDIDPRGRVVAVAPIGRADPLFFDAARKHILKRWKYAPATENGTAVASTLNVSIRFRMEG